MQVSHNANRWCFLTSTRLAQCFFQARTKVEQYASNILQDMTKIFSAAMEKGMTLQAVFDELDVDKKALPACCASMI